MQLKRKNFWVFKENFLFEWFLMEFEKKLLPFSKSVPSNFSICEVSYENKKYLHLRQKMLYLDIFELEISVLEFVLQQPLVETKKSLNLGANMPDWGIFGLELENYIIILEISTLEIISFQNFVKKWKWLN